MPAHQRVTTIEELLALPYDRMRHELLDGEHVLTPPPTKAHQRTIGALYATLSRAVPHDSPLEAFVSPAYIRLSATTLVQPDVFVVAKPQDPAKDTWKDTPVPLLAVEVTAPATMARDRGKKRRLYLEAGVEQYWVVDVDERTLTRHTAERPPEVEERRLEWSLRPSGVVAVQALF